ncbi:DUF1176 domain-containing protein [Shinella curvata]|uniref:DUF1176 domain-containing protein n=1 Tax=Shinella curvata TaxID=1817964 RepID=A0ABT8XM28_9HYPH|nr:DUF1176 domain-containing protein [Shinella curvata]MCJ8055783.1 DUF1176 domain-containing protein [Shinella curvata]MDO6124795.1 DUF1176 domain-containing protein [Shinella curvata]
MRRRTGKNIRGIFKPQVLAVGFTLLSMEAMAEEVREFRDWRAGCDNIMHCTALSLPKEDDSSIAYLHFERSAGADAPAALVLRVLGDWKTPSVPLDLKLDGVVFPVSAQAVADENGTLSLAFQPAEVAAFLDAARKATQLTVDAPGMTATVSLSGSVAAMLWIDEQQGRLDTTSALIRKGKSTNVPAALPLPVTTAKAAAGTLSNADNKALTTAMREELTRQGEDLCEDDEVLIDSDEAWPLDGGRHLIGLACSRGAYNLTTAFWLIKGKDVSTAKPVRLPHGESDTDNTLVNVNFDPKTGRMDFFSRGRGIGDCGIIGSFAWTGEAFTRTGFSMMGECRGIASTDWIPLYRSLVK